jgi:hypothetical protein
MGQKSEHLKVLAKNKNKNLIGIAQKIKNKAKIFLLNMAIKSKNRAKFFLGGGQMAKIRTKLCIFFFFPFFWGGGGGCYANLIALSLIV